MSKNRSPREVCSMTDGMMRFDGCSCAWLLDCRGSRVSCRSAAFPFRESRSASRASASSRGMRFTSEATRSSALRRRRSSRSVSKRPLSRSREQRRVGVVADELGLLAHELLDLGVGDLDPELVGGRVEHELARDRARRLLAEPRERAPPAAGRSSSRYVSSGMPRASTCRASAAQQLARARLDERPGRRRPSTRRRARRRRRTRNCASRLLRDLRRAAAPRSRRAARRASRTRSPSARARRRARGSTFSLISFTVTDTACFESSASSNVDLLRLAGVHADEALLDLLDDGAAAELDDVVAPRLALRRDRGRR